MIAVRVGLRNLARNRWRTGLTLGGIALSVAFMVWILGFMEGWMTAMVRGATAVTTSQVQVHTAAYAGSPRAYRAFPVDDALLATVRGVEDVVAVSPRVRLFGLVGNERTSQVATLLGVDPALEAAATPVAEGVTRGRWLSDRPAPDGAPREVVLGAALARQLGVGVGGELVTFFEAADGSLGNDVLEVVGLLDTGNSEVDRGAAYLHLEDARFLGALEGRAHELAVRTADLTGARETAAAVAGALEALPPGGDPPEDVLLVRPWQELMPSVDRMLTVSRQSYWFSYLLIYLVAAVGIFNTQRMSALERRREFGVLMAVGMRPRRLFGMVVTESLVLGILGGLLGTALGLAVTWWHAVAGLDLGLFTDQGGFTYMGVAFTGRLHAVLTATAALQPVGVMVLVAFLAGLWPALRTARLEAAPTIAGRTG